MKNFFTGYLEIEDVEDLDTAKELDRQHNIGLLKGVVIGLLTFGTSLLLAFIKN